MLVIPAIDIKDGKCVRLIQGKPEMQTIYSDNPVEVAKKWEKLGAPMIHVVDLDGAFTGISTNLDVITEMVHSVSIPIQLGGGIRSFQDIQFRLDSIGIKKVILGTTALDNPSIVEDAIKKYPGRIVVGVDAKDGQVSIQGWSKNTNDSPLNLSLRMKGMGVDTVIYTDISRDGMLQGPNFEAVHEMVVKTEMNIIASGGIHNLDDISTLKKLGVHGIILGKSLYTGAVQLKRALEIGEDR